MTFDSNRAWQDALALLRGARGLGWPLAGAFFLLPALASGLFLADEQAQFAQAFGNPAAVARIIEQHGTTMLLASTASLVVQGLGYLALTTLMAEPRRPTVGEALASGLRLLPVFVGSMLIFILGFMLASTIVGLFWMPVVALFGAGASQLMAAPLIVLFVHGAVRSSLALPVLAIEGGDGRTLGPLAALVRSWRLTSGQALRLFGFYLLLAIAYVVLASVITLIALVPVTMLIGDGPVAIVAASLVSSVIGAVAGLVTSAVLAAVYRQLVRR